MKGAPMTGLFSRALLKDTPPLKAPPPDPQLKAHPPHLAIPLKAPSPRAKLGPTYINIALPKPEMRIWCFGCSGMSLSLSSSKTQLDVRSVFSDSLRLPISGLELKEEGLVVFNRRCFDAKAFKHEEFTGLPDCDCCGDSPDEGIVPVEPEHAYACRSCRWCMPLCSRCMRTNGLEIHCARCLGADWNNEFDNY